MWQSGMGRTVVVGGVEGGVPQGLGRLGLGLWKNLNPDSWAASGRGDRQQGPTSLGVGEGLGVQSSLVDPPVLSAGKMPGTVESFRPGSHTAVFCCLYFVTKVSLKLVAVVRSCPGLLSRVWNRGAPR